MHVGSEGSSSCRGEFYLRASLYCAANPSLSAQPAVYDDVIMGLLVWW